MLAHSLAGGFVMGVGFTMDRLARRINPKAADARSSRGCPASDTVRFIPVTFSPSVGPNVVLTVLSKARLRKIPWSNLVGLSISFSFFRQFRIGGKGGRRRWNEGGLSGRRAQRDVVR